MKKVSPKGLFAVEPLSPSGTTKLMREFIAAREKQARLFLRKSGLEISRSDDRLIALAKQRPKADAEFFAYLTVFHSRRLRHALDHHLGGPWLAWLTVQFCNAAWSQRTVENEPYLVAGWNTMAGREKGIGRTRPKREFSPAQLDRVRALNDVPHKGRGKAEKALARKLETSPRTLQRLRHDL